MIRKIDGRGAHRQINHPALRRQHVDRIVQRRVLELLHPLGGIGDLVSLRNLDSGSVIKGTVAPDGTVRVAGP